MFSCYCPVRDECISLRTVKKPGGLNAAGFLITAPVVQWIECQIPVLMIGVRIPSGALTLLSFINKVPPDALLY